MSRRSRTLRPLHKREKDVLAFIQAYQLKNGDSPSRDEISRGLKLPNIMSAQRALEHLKRHGKLQYSSHSKRAIEVLSPQRDLLELPLLGTVAAGQPIEAIQSYDTIEVPKSMLKGSGTFFVLKVKGSSMIEEHICDGDLVIVRQQEQAEQGQKVVALLDQEVTLKIFYQNKGQIELRPANTAMEPLLIKPHQHLRILGIFAGLIRIQK